MADQHRTNRPDDDGMIDPPVVYCTTCDIRLPERGSQAAADHLREVHQDEMVHLTFVDPSLVTDEHS